jgi:ferredoxin-type protein NapH
MRKHLQVIGLSLFVIGFSVFNLSFFLSSFRLDEQVIVSVVQDKAKASLLIEATGPWHGKRFPSQFTFVSRLEETFLRINEEKMATYGWQAYELDRLVEAMGAFPATFRMEIVERVISGHSPQDEYKQKAFHDYGGWMDGREYANAEDVREHLRQVAESIRKYGIINQWGFDRYQVKDLTYSLTKAASDTPVRHHSVLFLLLTYGLCLIGAWLYIVPKWSAGPAGIKNNGIYQSAMKNRGWLGILTGTYLIAFYVFLYYFPEYMTTWVLMVDPISYWIKGSEAGRFFLYGFIYTLCILVMGVRMMLKYRHSRYQIWRTVSVMFFQTAFAFLIPEILLRLNKPYFDFKNIWPLDYDFFFDNELNTLIESGSLGIFMLGWGIALIVVAVPVLVYFFGKRWYCSWVCGCGGLAETLGDPYRQLSDKRLKAWQVERWMVHGVLVLAVVMTAGVLYTYWTEASTLWGINTYTLRETYGAWIGAGFAGVIGTGFYPLMGNRVWCRFGCPLAAYLGLVQRFKSRFRITTNGGQCISCGNCSTYCEMGIDVRWYAQRQQDIVRASCVGCGICAAVCPRGVLKLENTSKPRVI